MKNIYNYKLNNWCFGKYTSLVQKMGRDWFERVLPFFSIDRILIQSTLALLCLL